MILLSTASISTYHDQSEKTDFIILIRPLNKNVNVSTEITPLFAYFIQADRQ